MGGRGRGERGGLVTRSGLPWFPPEPVRAEGLGPDFGVLQLRGIKRYCLPHAATTAAITCVCTNYLHTFMCS